VPRTGRFVAKYWAADVIRAVRQLTVPGEMRADHGLTLDLLALFGKIGRSTPVLVVITPYAQSMSSSSVYVSRGCLVYGFRT
jgi:hypothetical protein